MASQRPTLPLVIFLALFAALTMGPNTAGADPVAAPVMGSLAGGIPHDIAIQGNYAYVAAQGALSILDISTPGNAIQVGFCDTPGSAEGVAVSGNYAYVADWDKGLRVINVSDPTEPTEVGHCDTPGYAYGVAVSGGHAYVADYEAGLTVINLSDLSGPVATYDTTGHAWDVAVDDGYAYVADGFEGMQIVNVSTPGSPAAAGSCSALDLVRDVVVADGYAYLADGGSGLRILDVSNPETVTDADVVSALDTPGHACGVFVDGSRAYVADGEGGLQVIDVSDPSTPAVLGSVDTPGVACAVATSGDAVYVADDWGGVRVADTSSIPSPTLVGQADTPGDAQAVAVSDWEVYVADGGGGLRVFDVSDATHPEEVDSYSDAEYALDVALAGDYAYVADGSNGLVIIDVVSPTPTATAVDTPGEPNGVAVSGNSAYVADGSAGLTIVDLTVPAAAASLSLDPTGSAYDVAVSGEYAYVAAGEGGLQIFDVVTPSGPVGTANTGGFAQDLDLYGGYAYVAAGDRGLVLVDVSTPTAPQVVSPPPFWAVGAQAVTVHNGYAYVSVGGSGVFVFDVSEAPDLEMVASCGTPSGPGPSDVAVLGAYAYVADGEAGLAVLDLLPPYTELAKFETPALAVGLSVVEQFDGSALAYMAGGSTGLEVIHVSDAREPSDPSRAGANRGLGDVSDVAVLGDYAYVTDVDDGLSVISALNPTDPHELVSLSTGGSALGVDACLIGYSPYALVADGYEGLKVISVRDPEDPREEGFYDTPGWASDVVAATLGGDLYACVADGDSGLRLLNISQIEMPERTIFSDDFEEEFAGWTESGTVGLHTLDPKRGARSVRLTTDGSIERTISTAGFRRITVSFYLGFSGLDTEAEYAAAQWYDGQDWYDLARLEAEFDPETGDPLAESDFRYFEASLWADADDNPDFALRFEINGDDADDCAYVDDVAVEGYMPYEPREVGFHNTPGQVRGVAVSGNHAYVADGDAGLRVIDVSSPADAAEAGFYDTLGWAEAVAIADNMAVVADGGGGLRVLTIATPSAPVERAYYDTPGWASDVKVLGDCAFVADTGWGLEIVQLWTRFRDVNFGHWAFLEIEAARRDEERPEKPWIVEGYPDGLYHPEFTISRDQIAVFIARAYAGGDENVPAGPAEATFGDVPTDHWAYKYVEYCWDNGIIEGYEGWTFRPGLLVARDQMAVFVARAKDWIDMGDDMALPYALFPDVPAGFWCGTAIEACKENGVVEGYPNGYYMPRWNISRDQMAVFIGRAYELSP